MRHLAVGLLLLLSCGLVYWQVYQFDFVNFDDNVYLVENERLADGLTWNNIQWAFTTDHHSNWHPVTWLSYLLDYELFGGDPGAMHVVNALVHAANVLLLYILLFRTTGAFWLSAIAALLFAVHPLRVESVAWLSERKDVLSGFFGLLTVLMYSQHVRKPAVAPYLLTVVFLVLGLMAKPILVTLPVLLLFWDYWPLRRSSEKRPLTLVAEKTHLFMLAGASAIMTLAAQQQGQSIQTFETIPLLQRIGNALVALVGYLWHTIFPFGLAVFYPHPRADLPVWQAVLAALLLAAITALVIVIRKNWPFLFTGWFWYLVALLPVIGIIQVGGQAMADRYTYLPHMALLPAVVWTVGKLLEGRSYRETVAATLAGTCTAVLLVTAYVQTSFWRNTETLFTRTVEVTEENVLAHDILGRYFLDAQRPDAAQHHFRRAVEINPDLIEARINYARALIMGGENQEAIHVLQELASAAPENVSVYYNLGLAYSQSENAEGLLNAIDTFKKAVDLRPDNYVLRNAYGNSLARLNRFPKAAEQFERAVKLKPDYALGYQNLGTAYMMMDEPEQARPHIERALELDPSLDIARELLNRLEEN